MNASNRIVIIGGVACGPKAAARARRRDPKARITVIEEGSMISYASCGIPYYVSGVVAKRSALLVRTAADFKNVSNIDILAGTRVEAIDRQGHQVHVVNLSGGETSTIQYDKLVIATGSNPIKPPFAGLNLAGIFSVKDVADADNIMGWLASSSAKRAVIVGAGLVGMEMAEVLMARGLQVSLVEALQQVLPGAMDEEIAAPLARYLTRKGVALHLGERVTSFQGEEGRVRQVVTGKSSLAADVVLLAIGVRPNVRLAREAGLAIGPSGAIAVNPMLQTTDPDIYAGGDCAENVHLVSRAGVFFPMGSTANKHGRVIGTNITGGRDMFPGVMGTTVVKAIDIHVGRTGLGEAEARAAGFDVVTALVSAPDRPDYYPGSKDVLLKVIADRKTGRMLGGQGMGRGELAKRIDVLATAITFGGTVEALANVDLGYAPPYNTALDPLHHAANVIGNKVSGMVEGMMPAEIKAALDSGEDLILLDVRSQAEWNTWRLEDPRVRLVPQNALLQRLDELPRDKPIVTICRRGGRAYQAALALNGAGFSGVRFSEGSLAAWPYECFGGEKETA